MTVQAVHGTPITPKHLLRQMAGASFCVSYYRPDQLEDVIPLLGDDSLLLLDNGAWSAFQRGTVFTEEYWDAYWTWAKDVLDRVPQAVAVVPDVIGGTVSENWSMFTEMPEFMWGYQHRLMMVWHMAEPISYLEHMVHSGFGYVAFGSTGEFLTVGTPAWDARIDEAFAAIDRLTLDPRHGLARPRVHMMRGLGQMRRGRHPFQTADSTNIAQNHHRYRDQADHVAAFRQRIEAGRFPEAPCAVWPRASTDEAGWTSPAEACREVDADNAALAATMIAYHNALMEDRHEPTAGPVLAAVPGPAPDHGSIGAEAIPEGRIESVSIDRRRLAGGQRGHHPIMGARQVSHFPNRRAPGRFVAPVRVLPSGRPGAKPGIGDGSPGPGPGRFRPSGPAGRAGRPGLMAGGSG